MAVKKVATEKSSSKPYNRTDHDGKKSGGKVKIKWVVSFISCTDDMRQTIRGLGLRRMHQVVERQDTPVFHAGESAPACGLAQEKGARGPRYRLQAWQDCRLRQQGAEIQARLF